MRQLLLWVALVAAVAGCGDRARRVTPIVVSVDGHVGSLRVDRSTTGDVVAAAGDPAAEGRAREPSLAPYRMLGYDCSSRETDATWRVTRRAFCRTVFFVNLRTRTLVTVFTTSPRYVEGHGVRIGMPTRRAERLLHRRVPVGCEQNVYLESGRARLTIAFAGGHAKIEHHVATYLIGGRASAFVLHSKRHDVGAFDCL